MTLTLAVSIFFLVTLALISKFGVRQPQTIRVNREED
jgi:hypothetical protein